MGSKSIECHFMVICVLIELWINNSLGLIYVYMALSPLNLYNRVTEVLVLGWQDGIFLWSSNGFLESRLHEGSK